MQKKGIEFNIFNKYNEAKKKAYNYFGENKIIKSSSLGNVHLNSDGFIHLIYKNEKHKRDLNNQITRFSLLTYLKPVLEGMKYYQEFLEKIQLIPVKKNSSIFLESKLIQYWGFVAVVNNKLRIKFILKKIGDGNIIFWSVIPSWKA